MNEDLMEDFKDFLVKYRVSWNSCNADEIMKHVSKELRTRWADTEQYTSDWGYEEAYSGWKQAFAAYKDREPEWKFEDLVTEINEKQEGIAVFMVRFKIDGSILNIKKLFVETFRKEDGEWKKIREYVELPISDR
jgi:hypothetical protein